MGAAALNFHLILASARLRLDFRSHELRLLASTSGVLLLATAGGDGEGSIAHFREHGVFPGFRLNSGDTSAAPADFQMEATALVGDEGLVASAIDLTLASAGLRLNFRSHELGLVASTSLIFLRATALVSCVVNQSRVHRLASCGRNSGNSGTLGSRGLSGLLAVASCASRSSSRRSTSSGHHSDSVS